jgi:hypothetical protein
MKTYDSYVKTVFQNLRQCGLQAKSNRRHFVIDLSTLTVMCETEAPRPPKGPRH